jgi:hypothetical protein
MLLPCPPPPLRKADTKAIMTTESINVISFALTLWNILFCNYIKIVFFHYDVANFSDPNAPRVNPAVSKDDGRITVSRCAAFSALGFVACASGGGGGGVKEGGYICGVGGGVEMGGRKT